jgi:uncharacterized small protein (DUF1192 family)
MDEENNIPLVRTIASFDEMSVEALNEHIASLEAEIEKAKSAIHKKKGAKDAADSFFK